MTDPIYFICIIGSRQRRPQPRPPRTTQKPQPRPDPKPEPKPKPKPKPKPDNPEDKCSLKFDDITNGKNLYEPLAI